MKPPTTEDEFANSNPAEKDSAFMNENDAGCIKNAIAIRKGNGQHGTAIARTGKPRAAGDARGSVSPSKAPSPGKAPNDNSLTHPRGSGTGTRHLVFSDKYAALLGRQRSTQKGAVGARFAKTKHKKSKHKKTDSSLSSSSSSRSRSSSHPHSAHA